MAEIEGGAEIQPFLVIVDAELGSFASSIPSQVRYKLAGQLMESSQLTAELQINTEKLEKENEGRQRTITMLEQIIEAKDSEIAVLKTELKSERAEKDALKTSKSKLEDSYNLLLEKNYSLDNRELAVRLEQKVLVWLCVWVPQLDFDDVSFGKTFTFGKMMHYVKEAMEVIHANMNPSGVAHLTSDAALELVRKALPRDVEYPNLDVLLAALIAKDNPLTFDELVDFDNYRKRMKNIGNEEAHGKRPEPFENFRSVIADMKDAISGGSDSVLSTMIDDWAAVYKSKWPFNTPTSMQQRNARRKSQTPMQQTPPPSQSFSARASERSANTQVVGTGTPRKNATTAKAAESNMKPCALDFSLQTSSSLSPRPGPSGSGLSHVTQINQPLSSARQSPQPIKSLPQSLFGALSTPRARGRKRHNDDSRDERNHKRHKGNNR